MIDHPKYAIEETHSAVLHLQNLRAHVSRPYLGAPYPLIEDVLINHIRIPQMVSGIFLHEMVLGSLGSCNHSTAAVWLYLGCCQGNYIVDLRRAKPTDRPACAS